MNKAQIIQKVKKIINQRRADADDFALQNYTQASTNIHFAANSSNIAATIIQIAKLESEKKNAKHEKELLKVLENERAEILKELDISEKSLTPQYTCKKCNDIGILGDNYCICFKSLINQELNKINGGSLNKTHSFKTANMNLIKKDSDMQKAYARMQEFCGLFPNSNRKIITLSGQVGVGKSYLTECVCNALIEKGALVQFLTAFSFNNTMLKYHTEFNQDKLVYLDSVLEPDVLVIDDLGTEPMLQNVTKEYLLLVLNERLNSNKTTLLTTNLTLEELMHRYGERIFSRISHKQNAWFASITSRDLRHKS